MTTFLLIVIAYLLMALSTKPEGADYWNEFLARILWPIVWGYTIWKCLTTEDHFTRNK